MQQKIITRSAVETVRVAQDVARKLRGGEVLLLEGELGTGKTTFVRGLARALGYRGAVRSPTFTLLHEYKFKSQMSKVKCLVHIDAYRLKSSANLRGLGIEEYLGKQDTVVAIEWGKKARSLIRAKHFIITLRHLDAHRRIIYVRRSI